MGFFWGGVYLVSAMLCSETSGRAGVRQPRPGAAQQDGTADEEHGGGRENEGCVPRPMDAPSL